MSEANIQPQRQHLAAHEVLPAGETRPPYLPKPSGSGFWVLAWIGNIPGGTFLVALPFWFAFRHRMAPEAEV